MTTFNQIINEQGFLSPEGKSLMAQKFLPAIQELFSLAQTENEIRLMSSVLSNLIGKTSTDLLQSHYDQAEDINQMSNQDFDQYLRNKYPDFNLSTSPITPEEMKRFQTLATQLVQQAMEDGMKNIIRDTNFHKIVDPFEMPEDVKATLEGTAKQLHKSKQQVSTLLDDLMAKLPKTSK